MRYNQRRGLLLAVWTSLSLVQALDLNVDDPASIKSTARILFDDLMSTYFIGNKTTPAYDTLFPYPPYYWWEAGGTIGGGVSYARYTGDASYQSIMSESIAAQASPTTDFMLQRHRFDLGNDDQVIWALTAMEAAEDYMQAPGNQSRTLYQDLARNVFNNMVSRWNMSACHGGLKWQFIPQNKGYDYRSTITTAGFFQLSARLAHFTGNHTYVDWAGKAWDWLTGVGFIDVNSGAVYDGAGDANGDNCTHIDRHEWSYNMGVAVYGAAIMHNTTADAVWRQRTDLLVDHALSHFFTSSNTSLPSKGSPAPASTTGILYEPACEPQNICSTDQASFKAYLARFLGKTSVAVPDLAPKIMPRLRASAKAAVQTCVGSTAISTIAGSGSTGDAGPGSTASAQGRECSSHWYSSGFNGTTGLGQQISALEVVLSTLVDQGQPAAGVPGVGIQALAVGF